MGKKIYVGNLSYSATEGDIAQLFAEHGTVESTKLITDRETGRSKGFAFVEMATDAEAAKAIGALNGTDFSGRSMNVTEAKPMAPKENRGGFRNNRY